MDLCTLDELKGFMGITDTGTTKDTVLNIYIQAVSSQIQKLIGRDLEAKEYVEKYRGTDSAELVLDNFPVNSITSVEFVVDGETYETLDDYDYDLDEESGILYKDDGWILQGYSRNFMSNKIDFPARHIKVMYNAGYTDVPLDLKLLCMQYISDLYAMDNSKGTLLTDYKIDDISMTFRNEIKLSESQLKTINSYKGVRF